MQPQTSKKLPPCLPAAWRHSLLYRSGPSTNKLPSAIAKYCKFWLISPEHLLSFFCTPVSVFSCIFESLGLFFQIGGLAFWLQLFHEDASGPGCPVSSTYQTVILQNLRLCAGIPLTVEADLKAKSSNTKYLISIVWLFCPVFVLVPFMVFPLDLSQLCSLWQMWKDLNVWLREQGCREGF